MRRVTITLAVLFIAGIVGAGLGWATPVSLIPRAALTQTTTPAPTLVPAAAVNQPIVTTPRRTTAPTSAPTATPAATPVVAPRDTPRPMPTVTYTPTPLPTPTRPTGCGGCGSPRYERPGIMCPMMAPSYCPDYGGMTQ